MDEEDFEDSAVRSRNSPYDHQLHRGFSLLRRGGLLGLYAKDRALGRGWKENADRQSLKIVEAIRREGDEVFHNLGRHVWVDYVRYLDSKRTFFPFYPNDPFYTEVWSAFIEDRKKTKQYADAFEKGAWPSEGDIEFILGELVRRTILAFGLTRSYRQSYPHAYFYNTWEYRPIVEIVAQELEVRAEDWAKLQDEEISAAWKCLSDAYEELDAKYRGRGVYHFVRKTTEIGLFRLVSQELRMLWERYDGNVAWITNQIRDDVQRTLDLVSSSRYRGVVGAIRSLAEDTAAVTGSATGVPFGLLTRVIRNLDNLRLKEGIQAYSFLFLLKQGGPLLDLPNLLPPFGPEGIADREEAIARMQERRWLRWTDPDAETESSDPGSDAEDIE